MNRRSLLLTTILVPIGGCQLFTTPVSPTLIQDGELVVAGLQTLSVVVTPLSAAAATVIGLAVTAINAGLNDLQAGSKTTPVAFAKVVNDEITAVATPLEADFKANTTIQQGLAVLQTMITVIGQDVTPAASTVPTAALGPDPRAALKAWMARRK